MISNLKKTVSVILVLIALISCISIIPTAAVETSVVEVEANAEGDKEIAETEKSYEDFKYIILDDQTILITKYTGKSNKVTVPEAIDDMDVSQIAEDAFEGYNYKKLTLRGYANSVAYFFAKQMNLKFDMIKFESIEIESFTATAINRTRLEWEAVDDAASYLIYYRRADQNVAYTTEEASLTSAEITLEEDQTYYFYVIARDNDLNEITEAPDQSYIYTCTTKVPITSLKNVSNGINITWNRVTGASYYRIYYKTPSLKSWKGLCDTDKTSYLDTTVKSGTTYTYTVRALDKNKNLISWYDKEGTTLTRLDQPQISDIENLGTSAKITWNKVSGAASYKVYYRRSYQSTWRLLGTSKTNTISDNNLTSGITYYYTVEAVNGKYVSSKDSAVSGYEFLYLSVPKITSVSANSVKGQIVISWNKVPGAEKYVLFYKRTDLNRGWKRVTVTSSTSYTDKGCTTGKTYVYTVRCIDNNDTKYTSYYDTAGSRITYSFSNNCPELKKAVITSGNGTYAKAYITWGTYPGAYKYRLFYNRIAPDGSKLTSSWKTLATIKGTAYGDYKLKYNYKYIYTVRAIDKNGNFISSYDATGISITPTAAAVKKAPGFLVKSNAIDSSYSSYPITLSDTDRYYAERIVMGESGDMSFEGMALVCQSLRDAYIEGGYSSILSTINGMGYVAPLSKAPNQKVKDCVKYIFDEGGAAAEHRVLVFYASNYCSSGWHESQCFIYQVGAVRYFDMWYF